MTRMMAQQARLDASALVTMRSAQTRQRSSAASQPSALGIERSGR